MVMHMLALHHMLTREISVATCLNQLDSGLMTPWNRQEDASSLDICGSHNACVCLACARELCLDQRPHNLAQDIFAKVWNCSEQLLKPREKISQSQEVKPIASWKHLQNLLAQLQSRGFGPWESPELVDLGHNSEAPQGMPDRTCILACANPQLFHQLCQASLAWHVWAGREVHHMVCAGFGLLLLPTSFRCTPLVLVLVLVLSSPTNKKRWLTVHASFSNGICVFQKH